MCKKLKRFSKCNSVEFGDMYIAMKHDRNGVPVMGLVSYHRLVTLWPWKARVGRSSFESQEESFTRKQVC